jgi:hypothetical protein
MALYRLVSFNFDEADYILDIANYRKKVNHERVRLPAYGI